MSSNWRVFQARTGKVGKYFKRPKVTTNTGYRQKFDSAKLPPHLPIGDEGSNSLAINGYTSLPLRGVITDQVGEVPQSRLGTQALTLDNVSTTQAGEVTGLGIREGDSDVLLADVGQAQTGIVNPVVGDGDVLLDDVGVSQTGNVHNDIYCTHDAQLDGIFADSFGSVIGHVSIVTLYSVRAVGMGKTNVRIYGASSGVLDDITKDYTGTRAFGFANSTVVLGDVLTQQVGRDGYGTSASTLVACTHSGVGAVRVSGAHTTLLNDVIPYTYLVGHYVPKVYTRVSCRPVMQATRSKLTQTSVETRTP